MSTSADPPVGGGPPLHRARALSPRPILTVVVVGDRLNPRVRLRFYKKTRRISDLTEPEGDDDEEDDKEGRTIRKGSPPTRSAATAQPRTDTAVRDTTSTAAGSAAGRHVGQDAGPRITQAYCVEGIRRLMGEEAAGKQTVPECTEEWQTVRDRVAALLDQASSRRVGEVIRSKKKSSGYSLSDRLRGAGLGTHSSRALAGAALKRAVVAEEEASPRCGSRYQNSLRTSRSRRRAEPRRRRPHDAAPDPAAAAAAAAAVIIGGGGGHLEPLVDSYLTGHGPVYGHDLSAVLQHSHRHPCQYRLFNSITTAMCPLVVSFGVI
ncbi:hypothetical protein PaG_00471 [Moesziomyces aphidis]|uniref:Uncharacterized protein n=1 Tax=Moesziomyces aphidis TaxID=84754 RepID=W3VU36_MOEAP|nr:hypothetical protein PaG_00471 [Moesziomyces aphidis]